MRAGVYMRQPRTGEQCCFQLACQSEIHVRVGGLYKQPQYIQDERERDMHYLCVGERAALTPATKLHIVKHFSVCVCVCG